MGLFQSTILKKHLKGIEDKITLPYRQYLAYFHNPEIQENIRNIKEEEFQEGFLRGVFVNVLGYTLNPDPNFNLKREQKNETGAKKADGAILVNGEVVGIIELKDSKTTDLKQVEAQAFGYKHYHKNASYVVISNFEKLRFYVDNAVEYEEFDLFALSRERFAVLWLCLDYGNIANHFPKQIRAETTHNEDQITKQLYKEYATFKRALFADLTERNPNFDRLTMFKKSQKLLDRFLFILFAEDCGLLPPNSIAEIIKQWESLKEMDEYKPLYDRLKKYFGYMNIGHKGKKHDIFAYNGGLFSPDEVLDNVTISDKVLYQHLQVLNRYDYSSEVDVNILGHIFEHSLSEIENLIPVPSPFGEGSGGEVSKRKKDGVFYTPRYITAYIVENTLGKLCVDKKAELEMDASQYFADKKRPKTQTKQLSDKLNAYRQWLLGLTICDPACGSGAFLNAALDFLITEHKLIDEMSTKLSGGSIVFPDIENAILENNLYGVDINEESVEIAKLALWLCTAKPNRKFNSLNDNIKCGNSLISPHPQPLSILERGEGVRTVEIQIPSQLLANARELRKNQTKAEDLLWQLLRGRKLNNLKFRRQHPLKAGFILDLYCAETKLGIELDGGYHYEAKQQEYDAERTKIINEYGIHIIRFTNEYVLFDTENVLKKIASSPHLPSPYWRGVGGEEKFFDWHKEFPQVFEKGGFDVVIGNPPYVRLESIREVSENLAKMNYQTYDKRGDLYQIFVERGFSLLRCGGYISYIMPNKWMQAGYGKSLREYLLTKELVQLIDFGDIQIFEGATTYPCIFISRNAKPKDEFSVSVLQPHDAADFYGNVVKKAKLFTINQFSGETWVISSQQDSRLLERLKKENATLEKFINGQSYRGILTGLTEAFLVNQSVKERLINEDPKAKELIKPVIRGRDILPWLNNVVYDYLIGAFPALGIDIDDYLSIKNYLLSFGKERLEQSGIIGSRKKTNNKWFETQDTIGYYQEFSKPKIMYQAFQVKPCFIFDENGLYCNNSMWFIPTDNKALLAILNSKMGWWLISKYCTQIQNGYQLIWKYFGQIPIPEDLPDNLGVLADKMLSLNSDLQTKRQRFLKRLTDNLSGIKITGILKRFDELEFKQFHSELAKQKITLSLKQQDEWEEFFNEYRTECTNLAKQINTMDKEIDGMVYGLYGLTAGEIGVIEK